MWGRGSEGVPRSVQVKLHGEIKISVKMYKHLVQQKVQ